MLLPVLLLQRTTIHKETRSTGRKESDGDVRGREGEVECGRKLKITEWMGG